MSRFGLTAGRDLVLVTAHPFDHVPFAAVAPEQTVRYASSAADVIRLAAAGERTGTGVLGVGNPEFENEEVRLRLVNLRNGIPIRRLESAGSILEEFTDTVLVGERAGESQFRETLATRSRWDAVHFAVPGLLDASSPYRSSLALAPGDGNDGLLTVHELMALRIRADLTVLAACEPAKGTRDVDRAIQGITQALHLAGSTRVIVSQWWIDDDAAAALMRQFYKYWANGETPAPLALRRAQQWVSAKPGWVHPKAWAGWQLWGAR
jgi:hypothetical protein